MARVFTEYAHARPGSLLHPAVRPAPRPPQGRPINKTRLAAEFSKKPLKVSPYTPACLSSSEIPLREVGGPPEGRFRVPPYHGLTSRSEITKLRYKELLEEAGLYFGPRFRKEKGVCTWVGLIGVVSLHVSLGARNEGMVNGCECHRHPPTAPPQPAPPPSHPQPPHARAKRQRSALPSALGQAGL